MRIFVDFFDYRSFVYKDNIIFAAENSLVSLYKLEDKRITSVSDYVAIDYHLDRLARDPAVRNKVAHVLCLQGEMKFQFNGSSFRLQKDGLLILPIQALMKSMEPSADFRCVCVYVNNEIIEIPFTPPVCACAKL